MKLVAIFSLLVSSLLTFGQDLYKENKTHTYHEAIAAYQKIASNNPTNCKLIENEFGKSDIGLDIPLFVMAKSVDYQYLSQPDNCIILINNAIHPGEPCGVEASIKLSQEMAALKNDFPENLVICIIPIYNVGGAENRNCCSRANQNGPEEYGFRGNARNLDLNRDFIKADSKNTRAFYRIFHNFRPHIFIDTHTSNGADYQYTMTLITSQVDKMNSTLSGYVENTLNPFLFESMEEKGYPMVPYVHTINKIPDNGIIDYLETPRYSTGYTNLFNCISYVTEAHMLKPFEDRVESTYEFLKLIVDYSIKNGSDIVNNRIKADEQLIQQKEFPLNWKVDTNQVDRINFKGYEATYQTSEVTGNQRLFYDQKQPFEKEIDYFHTFIPTDHITKPDYYVIPQAWDNFIPLFKLSQIPIYTIDKDINLEVEVYYIDDFETFDFPYEGHYLHKNVSVTSKTEKIEYHRGDFVIPTDNIYVRMIIETLEPVAADSYFNWNYFDAILQQKEWFSAYVFEDEAAEMLKNDPALKKEFEAKKSNDPEFANSDFAQLYFLYQRSDHYERTVNKYPVTRFNGHLDDSQISLLLNWK